MQQYCNSLTKFSRYKTREVMVGEIGVGGNNPVRIQSMTTTDTMDTKTTVEQSIRMIEAGCEIVRITTPSIKEANNLKNIKDQIRGRGFNTPIVADIHFTPNAAEIAAKIVEKVRINPGNYVDKKQFKFIEYSEENYEKELDKIRKRFIPLLKICKSEGTALRIGTNHGSLSDRIMSHYGDTPSGMVESAMEFLRIAVHENFKDIIISMKASNTQVMVQAYRLLVKNMEKENMNFPLHLGVTEAGEAEDGRIKSSLGIGTLLEDGLGDTIRVSLTEEPEDEIPVAKELVSRYKLIDKTIQIKPIKQILYDPFFHSRRKTINILNLGHNNVPRVVANLSKLTLITQNDLISHGYIYSSSNDKWHVSDQAVDYIYIGDNEINFRLPSSLMVLSDKIIHEDKQFFRLVNIENFAEEGSCSDKPVFINLGVNDFSKETRRKILKNPNVVLVLMSKQKNPYRSLRRWFHYALEVKINNPIIVRYEISYQKIDKFLVNISIDCGGLFIDGFGDGIWLDTKNESGFTNETIFGVLQASRMRISKTEYISCPSCGRTLFDLQETTGKIRERTSHLKGIKIGVMGCIVNGPGEMADADYGYVGTGEGKISLYKGQNLVKRGIPTEKAVDELVNLISENGDWIDPPHV